MIYTSTKTMEHVVSSAFRQHKAHSHCKYLHGYGLSIRFKFEAVDLDANNWVVDFGSLKSLKGAIEDHFDHKTVVAEDDPEMAWFEEANKRGILQLVVLPATGCEKFAEYIMELTRIWLIDNGYSTRVDIREVEVMEHSANSAFVTSAVF